MLRISDSLQFESSISWLFVLCLKYWLQL